MYTSFFGLKEIPFSIAPNPHYLYMSDRHREALAHLTYGLGETGGFVLLTGEVGTGKTTVSRCLIEQLPENTQAAFILNPTLSSQELLATICDEYKIRYRKTGATLKTLTDKIQEKLLKNHETGKNTLLIIDEAQHLKAEVLEQLRLLTNLETHTKKLLQVILIGQPELQQLLQRRDLRQLAQRITARYHLLPLTKQEVRNYIQHRLSVAECHQQLFTSQAMTTIHQLSDGIPRLINLLCDRALLGAYGANKQMVDKKIVMAASVEALGYENLRKNWWHATQVKAVAAIGLCLLIISIGYYIGKGEIGKGEQGKAEQENGVQFSANDSTAVVQASDEGQSQNMNWVVETLPNRSLPESVRKLFSLWRIVVDEATSEPCHLASDFDFACYWYKGNLAGFLKLNYPGVFKFIDGQGVAFYGLLSKVDGAKLSFNFFNQQGVDQVRVIDQAWLDKYWQGGALVLWQAPKNNQNELVAVIDQKSSGILLQWLEDHLSQAQQRPTRSVKKWDAVLENQLQQYQRQYGMITSPKADLRTLMLLSNTVSQGLPVFELK
ncbi:MAG: AAA family ATPase [Alteromonadaceae bacterium]|nr:AAA family ATPase [Alteromonadaceae bacterium]